MKHWIIPETYQSDSVASRLESGLEYVEVVPFEEYKKLRSDLEAVKAELLTRDDGLRRLELLETRRHTDEKFKEVLEHTVALADALASAEAELDVRGGHGFLGAAIESHVSKTLKSWREYEHQKRP